MALLSNVPTANVPASMSTQFFPVPRSSFKKRDINELVLGQLQSGFYRAAPDFRNGVLSESTTGNGPPNMMEAMMALRRAQADRARFPGAPRRGRRSVGTQTDPPRGRRSGGTQTDPPRELPDMPQEPHGFPEESKLPGMPQEPHGFPPNRPRHRADSGASSATDDSTNYFDPINLSPSVRWPNFPGNNGNLDETVQDREAENNPVDQNSQNMAHNQVLRDLTYVGGYAAVTGLSLAARAAMGVARGAGRVGHGVYQHTLGEYGMGGVGGEPVDQDEEAEYDSAPNYIRMADNVARRSHAPALLPYVDPNNEAGAPQLRRSARSNAGLPPETLTYARDGGGRQQQQSVHIIN